MTRIALLLMLVLAAATPARLSHAAMVATANPHASRAAIEILKKGGSAVDAAIAAQLVLGLTEPQSSGIGGGAFMVHWQHNARTITAFDGRETAPAAATPGLFMGANGKPLKWRDANYGGRAVGVPGTVSLLWLAHQKHGRLPWNALFEPAITLALKGFAVSPRLHNALASAPEFANDRQARAIYYVPSKDWNKLLVALPEGALLRNPAYAKSLKIIAEKGPAGFYQGPLARQIVAAVRGHHANPGAMTLNDLAAYQARQRTPVCGPYRGYKVCAMPPPTSGGLSSLMTLAMLEKFPLSQLPVNSAAAAHLLVQASKLAFADRALYMADPDFIKVPVKGLLARDYLERRAALIRPDRDMGRARAGQPAGHLLIKSHAPDAGLREYGTSHLVIVDNDGNAVSMTMTVERSLGARVMAGGFVLNNELTDFSFRPQKNGRAVANRVEGGKRPRSSMDPVLVFAPSGEFFAGLGSPGGSRIIGYVTQALIGLIDWNLSAAKAAAMAHIVNRNGATDLEANTAAASLKSALEAMGHKVRLRKMTSGLNIIVVRQGKLEGGTDPRREGLVLSWP